MLERLKELWHGPTMVQISNYSHRYFFRYFLDSEVGHFWAILNGMLSTFALGFLALYAMKGWGLRSWNKNLIKNKQRFIAIALRKTKEELYIDGTEAKLAERKRISSLKFNELREKLQNGMLTATQVVDAFRWKSFIVNEKFNCITDFIKEAPQMALDLDAEFKNLPKPPLFGMPFSVKENFHMIGYDVTLGLADSIEQPVQDEATLVAYLKSLGGVPIARTNVPQTMLSFACSNPIFGVTKNPHNIDCCPGGSSGGEGVLVACGGSIFGLGSDVGGSLRIPSHFCGTVTVKPTERRLSTRKSHTSCDGCPRIALCYGFITRDVQAQEFLLSLVFNDQYFSLLPELAPVKFDKTLLSGKQRMRIGFLWYDGWIEATPACRRAVEMASSILEKEGHELVPFTVPAIHEAYNLACRVLFPDNGAAWINQLQYEQVDPTLWQPNLLLRQPLFVRSILAKIFGLLKFPQLSILMNAYNRNMTELYETYKSIKQYRRDFLEKWAAEGLDALVCPVMPFPAISGQWASQLNVCLSYTKLYNLLDMPSGVVPITKSTAEDRTDALQTYPSCLLKGARQEQIGLWQHPIYSFVRQAVQDAGDNLPVGVQVVSLPYREETCLKVMAMLEKGARFEMGI